MRDRASTPWASKISHVHRPLIDYLDQRHRNGFASRTQEKGVIVLVIVNANVNASPGGLLSARIGKADCNYSNLGL